MSAEVTTLLAAAGPNVGGTRSGRGGSEAHDDGARAGVDLDELVAEAERPVHRAGAPGTIWPLPRRRRRPLRGSSPRSRSAMTPRAVEPPEVAVGGVELWSTSGRSPRRTQSAETICLPPQRPWLSISTPNRAMSRQVDRMPSNSCALPARSRGQRRVGHARAARTGGARRTPRRPRPWPSASTLLERLYRRVVVRPDRSRRRGLAEADRERRAVGRARAAAGSR